MKEYEQRLLTALKDAAFMLKGIKDARELPAYAEVHKQYIALGREIDELIKEMETSK